MTTIGALSFVLPCPVSPAVLLMEEFPSRGYPPTFQNTNTRSWTRTSARFFGFAAAIRCKGERISTYHYTVTSTWCPSLLWREVFILSPYSL
ncbi:hypothetical protein F5B22DRAFT_614772 [Xylaria bambusicola]|uniref:uncharacterized protein n=1 Tax=Xylaria bambusicola TaxID=326684 RepID=UPI00200755D0|nr:uncharacterized protein F5B22DRAFT_614772 [Xylaria bambusicola]KAI0512657.1 hypothetical protein F5B22DRAFT_614772 [Xylaria bambusicola]